MKITETGGTKLRGVDKKGKKSGVTGNFSAFLESSGESEAASEVSAPNGVNMIDSLIAVQQMEIEGNPNQESLRHGQELLDFLDEIKLGMLGGAGISLERLNRLKDGLRKDRGWVMDNKIAGVLDEIEIRAKVEIAKMEAEKDQ